MGLTGTPAEEVGGHIMELRQENDMSNRKDGGQEGASKSPPWYSESVKLGESRRSGKFEFLFVNHKLNRAIGDTAGWVKIIAAPNTQRADMRTALDPDRITRWPPPAARVLSNVDLRVTPDAGGGKVPHRLWTSPRRVLPDLTREGGAQSRLQSHGIIDTSNCPGREACKR